MTELIVRVADLAEAEGRSLRGAVRAEARELRQQASRFSVGLVMLAGAGALALIGAALCVATVYTALEPVAGGPAALLGAGLFALLGAGVLIWVFKRMTTR
jgi:hypothetical protein